MPQPCFWAFFILIITKNLFCFFSKIDNNMKENVMSKDNVLDDDFCSIAEAGLIMGGYDYHTAYKKIVKDKLVSYHDGGKRDKKVYRRSAEAYRAAHRVQGVY